MLYAMLAACAILIFVLAVPGAAKAHHLARLFRAQEQWTEQMDRESQPSLQCPLAGRATGPRNGNDESYRPTRRGPRPGRPAFWTA